MFFLGAASAADLPESGALDSSAPSELRPILERYATDLGGLRRSYYVPNSPARQERLESFYRDWLARLDGLDFDAMSQTGRVDYVLFKNQLDYELRQLAIQSKNLTATDELVPFAQTIVDLEEARRWMEPVDAEEAATVLDDVAKEIAALQNVVAKKLESKRKKDRIKISTGYRAAQRVDALGRTIEQWFHHYNGYDPVFEWWVAKPHAKLKEALDGYEAFLREEIVGTGEDDDTAIVGDPIGREALLNELAHEMIPYTPEELIAIANREFAWCDREMKRASQELGYGDDWRAALEYVKNLHVDPGEQPALIRALAEESTAFIEAHDLVTIPPMARDNWRLEMMSPERQLVNPFFTGGEVISVSFPTDTMSHEQKRMSMRGNNKHFSRATVHHEIIPGHHLQIFMTDRHRTYRSIFRTPYSVEGWALYWEMMLWDMEFQQSPEDRIGMLFWRSHRCARIIFSLRFHLEEMTPEECIEFLVDRVGHERENAAGEVRRSFAGNYSPLYQSAYLLGGLQFRALHEELVQSGNMTDRAFHDTILRQNNIPVEMIRAVLTEQPISRNFKSNWKFYDEKPSAR
jgi:uncharacterized protein (DUF885 family)